MRVTAAPRSSRRSVPPPQTTPPALELERPHCLCKVALGLLSSSSEQEGAAPLASQGLEMGPPLHQPMHTSQEPWSSPLPYTHAPPTPDTFPVMLQLWCIPLPVHLLPIRGTLGSREYTHTLSPLPHPSPIPARERVGEHPAPGLPLKHWRALFQKPWRWTPQSRHQSSTCKLYDLGQRPAPQSHFCVWRMHIKTPIHPGTVKV